MHFTPYIYSALAIASAAYALPQNPESSALHRRMKVGPPSALGVVNYHASCTAERKAKLDGYFTNSLKAIDDVLYRADVTREMPHSLPYKTFMDISGSDDVAAKVATVFRGMKTLLTTGAAGLNVQCGDKNEAQNAGGKACGGINGAIAWAKPGLTNTRLPTLNFCDVFFSDSTFNQKALAVLTEGKTPPKFSDLSCKNGAFDLKAAKISEKDIDLLYYIPEATIIHEMSHLHAVNVANVGNVDIGDCYYGALAAETLAFLKPTAAMYNADNYAWYALANWINTICYNPSTVIYRSEKDSKGITSASFESQYDTLQERVDDIKKYNDKFQKAKQENDQDDMVKYYKKKSDAEKLVSSVDREVCYIAGKKWSEIKDMLKLRDGL